MPEEPLSVHPETLIRQANLLLDGITQSKVEHGRHHDTLASAGAGMLDATKAALEKAHEALVDQTRVLHHQLTQHADGMQEFTGLAVTMDEQNRVGFK
ncbi:Uncharacterised protein [Mycobacteroides abscessus subsp. bolletii]|uniref:hypothetical protein n=1 Tax=Mycobacteroides abscessus TaxID=36809 RepID=UPI0009258A63|nr:hypothetical protein [Mycobacteroides abscessus]RIR57688.1 hypothetical protein D2E37_05540 [Mycobacteroides abscessus]RIS85922.1 hypothetical protein D2E53_05540 [Mycobacteroides abscessus]SHV00243.1 Uncharacterised protein [Mycobacteroides abscessus subsp. abscessus]SKF66446.1 Uncharacterised protein [Mycobacteroides abscessus subsp. bolletii]SKF72156.1 Uncharacterised protein [Mycobacteroides abscessus subsp. bolletii]